MRTSIALRLRPIIACVLTLVAYSTTRAADTAALDRKILDQRIYTTLRDVINKGADLYNSGDQNGCYRLYEGALMALQPLLDHRPEMQKAITDGIDNARRNPELARRAFVLRDVIDKVRFDINPKEVDKNPLRAPPEEGSKPAPPSGRRTLWDRLGGEANVKQIVDDFVELAATDPKVDFERGGKFPLTEEKRKHLKQMLVEQISANTGGPYKKYTGKDMKTVHAGMGITDEQFDASKNDFKKALERNGAKADDVKAVLAVIESTRKDIVEKKPEPPKEEAETTADVSGKITFKGKPLTEGKVIFHPEEGKSISAEIKEDGSYSVKGILPGKYTLTVDPGVLPKVVLPAKYSDATTSGLQFTVIKGKQTHDIALE